MEQEQIRVDLVRTDGGTQPRARIDARLVSEYAEVMEDDVKFPPIVVFHDGDNHWLADGFHRLAAARALGRDAIDCDLRQGTRDDAVWFSCGANAAHGRRRTNLDKRRAVETALNDPRAEGMSNRELARHCGVSHTFISKIKRIVEGEVPDPGRGREEEPPRREVLTATEEVQDPAVSEPEPERLVAPWEPEYLPRTEPGISSGDGGGGGGEGSGEPREVSIAEPKERAASEKRSIKLPRDPLHAANVILNHFSAAEIRAMIEILETNLDEDDDD